MVDTSIFLFRCREINSSDGLCRALRRTFYIVYICVINICQIVRERDSFKLTCFSTFPAADTGHIAIFLSPGTFFLVPASNVNTFAVFTAISQFYNISRASSNADAAGNTSLFNNNRQFSQLINIYSIKFTCCRTVAAP